MSKTFDIDEKGRKKYDSFGQPVYIERDKWFRIKVKFLWKNAPQLQGQPQAAAAAPVPAAAPAAPAAAPAKKGRPSEDKGE